MRLIAQGGMGTIYEGRHIGTGKRCAVKLLSSPGLNKDIDLVRRLFREARACSVLEHEHVVQVFDSGIDSESGQAFIVMELLPGDDLERILKQSAPLEPSVAARIMLQAATGMAKAHRIGILHRDLKPANLFVSLRDSGEVVVKILDFGVAKVRVEDSLDISSGSLTRTGRLLGTPLYMSPEQIRNEGQLDTRSDVWSLGVVLFEMLSGTLPYSRKRSFGELMVSILAADLPLLQDVAPWVDPELARVTHRAMSRALDLRYRDAEQLRQALAALLPGGARLEQREVQTVPRRQKAQTAVRLSLPSPDLLRAGSAPPVETAPRVAPRQAGLLALAGGLGVLAALGWGGVMGLRGGPAVVRDASTAPVATASPASAKKLSATQSSAAQAVPGSKTHSVRVGQGVKVEVRGVPFAVQNGQVFITGVVGETFAIRLRQGARVSDLNLVLAERGPEPEKLELPAPVRRGRLGPASADALRPSEPPVQASEPPTEAPPRIELTETTDEFDRVE